MLRIDGQFIPVEIQSDAFIALPGGFGTFEEFFEVLTWAQIGIHSKPIGLLNTDGYFDTLLKFFDEVKENGFTYKEIAQKQSITVNAVGLRLGRCLDKLIRIGGKDKYLVKHFSE